MTHEEIVSEVGKPILRPLGLTQLVFLIAMAASPFLWIWHSWAMAWKTGLTGLLGVIVMTSIYHFVKKLISDGVKQEMEKNPPLKKTSFQERLEAQMNKKANQ